MVSGKFSVLHRVVIILAVIVKLGQSCPELRECFPDVTVTVPCQGSFTRMWTTEPSDTDCSTYVACLNGVGVKMCCPIGQYYNPDTQECDDETNVDCQIEPPPCPDTTTSNPDETTITTSSEETTTQNPDTTTTSSEETTTQNPDTTTTSSEETTTENPDTTTTSSEETTTENPDTTTTSSEETTTENPDTTTTSSEETTTENPETTTTATTNDADTTTQQITTTDETTSTAAIETTTVEEGVDLAALCAALTSDSLVELAYPGECNMYIMCENRQYIRTETCPAGLHFNPTLSVCDSPDQAECLDFVCRNNPEGNQVTLESQNSCQLYFICIGNITVERRCAPGTIYEAENGWCVVDDAENPCERERLPAPPESVILQCTGENELDKIPHPTMCDVYYRCINGNLWVRQCPPGLLFDPDREQCNLADMVSCVEAQQSVKYKQ